MEEINKDTQETDYEGFMRRNRIRVNKYLNIVLCFFVVTGPAIAIGIKAGFFMDVSYSTCLWISIVVAAVAVIHYFLRNRLPDSLITAIYALTAMDILLVYMTASDVNIYLTWFLVPLMSLLYCDRAIYFYSLALNYLSMIAVTWFTAPHHAPLRGDHDSALTYFADVAGGFTIETVIMLAAGYMIWKLMSDYFGELLRQSDVIGESESLMREKMDILDSMAEIYDNVNLIDFVNNTEMSLRDSEQKKHGIDMNSQTQTLMNQRLKNQVMPDQMDEFLTFTNIKTVRARLSHKKLLSADFIDVVSGWFRAQYITVDSTLDGIPNIVIYTTRNVDEEKRREEHLIRISLTDEMTRLFNRRCYDEDLKKYRNGELADDFVLFSIDVNGLKKVNDTKGHAAGDELIKGAADCLALSFGSKGKVYRTGGDEFMAVIHTDDPESIRSSIKSKADEWHGIYNDEIAMSVGYAAHKSKPEFNVDDLEHMADADMYNEKEKYYKEKGIERRR